jgi:mono/diheme cytochrome c family protein
MTLRPHTFLFCVSVALASACGSSSSPKKDSAVTPTPDAAAERPPADAPGMDVRDAPVADAPGGDSSPDGQVLTGPAARGQYLAGVLNCGGCHTPLLNGVADNTKRLSGRDCATPAGDCLSSGNLTNDVTGIKNFTDQQIVDAFRTGKFPSTQDGGVLYLFDNMPYYNYANLSDEDAAAIVAYLRAIPPISHTVAPLAGRFVTRPSAAESAPVLLAALPSATPASASATKGKYLASLACFACHTVPATADGGALMPKRRDAAKAYQGGIAQMITGDAGTAMFSSANLTPDMTGLKDWTKDQIVAAIKTAKDRMGKTFCAPMRANAAITDEDALSIADYLLGIPPVASMQTACSAR